MRSSRDGARNAERSRRSEPADDGSLERAAPWHRTGELSLDEAEREQRDQRNACARREPERHPSVIDLRLDRLERHFGIPRQGVDDLMRQVCSERMWLLGTLTVSSCATARTPATRSVRVTTRTWSHGRVCERSGAFSGHALG